MYHYKINTKNGFSLIELLVGMTIIITATTIILSIVVTSFRISSKATVVDNARQNGNFAMNRMIRMIQFADSYNGGNDGTDASINNPSTFLKDPSNCDGDRFGAISVNYEKSIKIFQCRNGNNQNSIDLITATNPIVRESLLNSNNLTLSNCEFTCNKVSPTASPVISIRFDLKIGNDDSLVEKRSFIPFFTSVKMRNE